jgi:hypothetical protein
VIKDSVSSGEWYLSWALQDNWELRRWTGGGKGVPADGTAYVKLTWQERGYHSSSSVAIPEEEQEHAQLRKSRGRSKPLACKRLTDRFHLVLRN